MKLLILTAVIALTNALEWDKGVSGYKGGYQAGSYKFHGRYGDKCQADGLYFRDDRSFVFCSNGNSYVQPCAPGTRNAAYNSFSYGKSYGYNDFCGVNLNDYGYGSYGYGKPGYSGPAYGKGDNYARKEVSYERKNDGYNYGGADYERKQVTYERRDRDGGYGGYAAAPRGGYERKQVSYERRDRDGYGYGDRSYGYGGSYGDRSYEYGGFNRGYDGYGYGPRRFY